MLIYKEENFWQVYKYNKWNSVIPLKKMLHTDWLSHRISVEELSADTYHLEI